MPDLRDTRASYPIVPTTEVPAVGLAMVDARLYIVFPASDPGPLAGALDELRVDLIGLDYTNSIATFTCTSRLYANGTGTLQAELLVGRDARPTPGSSYVVMSSAVAMPANTTYEMHPDCFVVSQEAPVLTVNERIDVSLNEQTATTDPMALTALNFLNGNNVLVEWLNDGVSLTAGSGLGLGVYSEPPYDATPAPTYKSRKAIGLRSVCGASGDVRINGGPSVGVSVSPGANTLTLTIQPKLN